MRHGTILLPAALIAVIAVIFLGAAPEASARTPDIVLVVADDLGFSDLGCYGGEIRTPRLDEVAEGGIRFRHFYNAARCCPSRASLITGLYPHQAGVGHMTYDAGHPSYRGDLRTDTPTIAEVLRGAGYRTAMCGKWHLSPFTKPDDPAHNRPRQRGFDRFFGTLPGYGSLWEPFGMMLDDDFIEAGDGFFYTDAMVEHAGGFIGEAGRDHADQPLFLYLAFVSPHYPIHAREETIASYAGHYDEGWDKARAERLRRMVEGGILPERAKLPPRDPASVPWEDEPEQAWQAGRMEAYAAMVTELDAAIGQIVDRLKAADRWENTLFVFLSDNGGSNEGHLNNTIERMAKPWTSSLIPETAPDGSPVVPGDIPGRRIGGPDTFGSYGPRWASVSNTPFRRHKSWAHEGGIATPCIVHLPAGTPGEDGAGEITSSPSHLVDLMPTFAEAAGVEAEDSWEGRSLWPTFTGEEEPERALGWEHEGNRAFRLGHWKIVSEFPGTWTTMYPYDKAGAWELYDLAADPTELSDLAGAEPEKLAEMVRLYEEWAERIGVVQWEELEGRKE